MATPLHESKAIETLTVDVENERVGVHLAQCEREQVAMVQAVDVV